MPYTIYLVKRNYNYVFSIGIHTHCTLYFDW